MCNFVIHHDLSYDCLRRRTIGLSVSIMVLFCDIVGGFAPPTDFRLPGVEEGNICMDMYLECFELNKRLCRNCHSVYSNDES